jgi:hypothetical protein
VIQAYLSCTRDAKSIYGGLVEFLAVDSSQALRTCCETSLGTALQLVKGLKSSKNKF